MHYVASVEKAQNKNALMWHAQTSHQSEPNKKWTNRMWTKYIEKKQPNQKQKKERHKCSAKQSIRRDTSVLYSFSINSVQLPMGFCLNFYLTHDIHNISDILFPTAVVHICFFRCSSLWWNAAHTQQQCTTPWTRCKQIYINADITTNRMERSNVWHFLHQKIHMEKLLFISVCATNGNGLDAVLFFSPVY